MFRGRGRDDDIAHSPQAADLFNVLIGGCEGAHERNAVVIRDRIRVQPDVWDREIARLPVERAIECKARVSNRQTDSRARIRTVAD